MRFIFAGTPKFAEVVLTKLLEAGFSPCAVLCQPDRPAGRGRRLTACPVKERAVAANIPVHQPTTLKDEAGARLIADYEPDLMIVVAYGLILPTTVLDTPKHGCINIHASLLPRWRGASPIQQALLAGDATTGITLMQMDAGLDTGSIIEQRSFDIAQNENASTLHDKLAMLGGEMMVDCLQKLITSSQLSSEAQDESEATYARKITKAQAEVDWNQDAADIARQVQAYHGWPVAHCQLQGEYVRIWRAEARACPETWQSSEPGTVLGADEAAIFIRCGEGLLAVNELQLAGYPVWTADVAQQARSAWF